MKSFFEDFKKTFQPPDSADSTTPKKKETELFDINFGKISSNISSKFNENLTQLKQLDINTSSLKEKLQFLDLDKLQKEQNVFSPEPQNFTIQIYEKFHLVNPFVRSRSSDIFTHILSQNKLQQKPILLLNLTERQYTKSAVDRFAQNLNILEYKCPGFSTCSLRLTLRIFLETFNFLQAEQQAKIYIHSFKGRGELLLAFILTVIFRGSVEKFQTVRSSFDVVKGVLDFEGDAEEKLVYLASHDRYLLFYDAFLGGKEVEYNENWFRLKSVQFKNCPEEVLSKVYVELYTDEAMLEKNNLIKHDDFAWKTNFTSIVSGDILLRVRIKENEKDVVFFRYLFNTSSVKDNHLSVPINELDSVNAGLREGLRTEGFEIFIEFGEADEKHDTGLPHLLENFRQALTKIEAQENKFDIDVEPKKELTESFDLDEELENLAYSDTENSPSPQEKEMKGEEAKRDPQVSESIGDLDELEEYLKTVDET
eukprot:maker-scaffold_21-snap-gene-4.40-mRNA-1 protein AED:0.00 eAED:0.00 QI:84/1/1/1/1/1/2/97/481